jgi:HD-GYP domain-containing protein (c-di-GMP phosphodiesterase class II)
MVSPRAYHPARSLDDAMTELASGRGRLYDSSVADAAIALLETRDFVFSSELCESPTQSTAACTQTAARSL